MRQLWHRQCACGYPPLWITTGFSLALTQPLFAEQEGLTSLTQAPRRFLVQLRAGSVPRLSRWQKTHLDMCRQEQPSLSLYWEDSVPLLPTPQQPSPTTGRQQGGGVSKAEESWSPRPRNQATLWDSSERKEGVRAHDPTPAHVKTRPLPALLPPEVLGGRWLLLGEGDKDIRLELFQRKLKLAFMSMKHQRRWGLADNKEER